MTSLQLRKLRGKIVEVKWGDAHSADPWTDLDELHVEPLPCLTYGVVTAVNDLGIIVSGSVNGASSVGANWFLPKGMITSVRTLS